MILPDFVRNAVDRFVLEPSGRVAVAERQAGAIPYTFVGRQPVFLLITSRRSGRWIFPKGSLKKSMAPWELAAREAVEEAGVEGEIETQPVGCYRTWKYRGFSRSCIEVDMYPLRVVRQMEEWAEKGQRHRHWATHQEVRRLVPDKRLLALVGAIVRKTAGGEASRTEGSAHRQV